MKRSASKPDAYRKWREHRVALTAGQQHHHEPTRVVGSVRTHAQWRQRKATAHAAGRTFVPIRQTGLVVRAAVVVSAVVVLLLGLVWGLQRHLIYLPATEAVPPAAAVLPGAREVILETSDGLNLGAWFVPAGQPDRGMAVLVANGNAGNRTGRVPLARALAQQGLAVVLFDYRGYGGNPGNPDERGLARDGAVVELAEEVDGAS
jgi:Mrp family chromosome partitioning ATPase